MEEIEKTDREIDERVFELHFNAIIEKVGFDRAKEIKEKSKRREFYRVVEKKRM